MDPDVNTQQDQATDPVDEGMMPTDEVISQEEYKRFGACEEVIIDGESRYFSYDIENECSIECGQGEQTHCYDVWDECIDWDSTGECVQYEMMTYQQELPYGCTKLHVEDSSFQDPSFECYEWK